MGFFGPPGSRHVAGLGRAIGRAIPGTTSTGKKSGTFKVVKDMSGNMVVVRATKKKVKKGFRMPRLYAEQIRANNELVRAMTYKMLMEGRH